MPGDFAGGLEILLHGEREHLHGFGVVVETFTASPVTGKELGRLEIHAGQIPDGVVVFRLIQSSKRVTTRILDRSEIKFVDGLANPGCEFGDFGFTGALLAVFRRHDSGLDLFDDTEPFVEMDDDVPFGFVRFEVEARPAFFVAVASGAVLLENGLDLFVFLKVRVQR